MSPKTPTDELVDNHVSLSQCEKAVIAIRNYGLKVAKKREETELISGKEDNIWLVLTVKKTQPEKKLKPFKIPLAHPAVDPRTTNVCLITKDPQREYKDLLATHNVKFISRVVGVEKLKGKFKPFEARRMLMKENGLFLADERVVPLLPGLLGKIFFDAKKQPIPVCLTRKDLKGELERAISSTYMHQNQGTCTSIKIGSISQSPAQLLDNIKTALPAIVKRVQGGWENVQSFNVKTSTSVSLPIWACDLGTGGEARWPVAVEKESTTKEKVVGAADEAWTGFGGDSEVTADDGETEEVVKVVKTKGKRKAIEKEEVDTPTKKAKKGTVDDTEKRKSRVKKTSEPETLASEGTSTPSKVVQKEKRSKETGKESKKKASEASLEAPTDQDATPKNNKSDKTTKKPKPTSSSTSTPSKAPKPSEDAPPKPDTPAESVITPAELKKKRSDKGIEKKKGVIMKVKGGKAGAAKKDILGKSAKVRF